MAGDAVMDPDDRDDPNECAHPIRALLASEAGVVAGVVIEHLARVDVQPKRGIKARLPDSVLDVLAAEDDLHCPWVPDAERVEPTVAAHPLASLPWTRFQCA